MPLLNLPLYSSTIIDETEHDIHIQIALTDTTRPDCPYCGSTSIQSHGKRHRHFMDIPIRGKRVGLNIDVPRYRCKGCGKTFAQTLPAMSDEYKMTERLEKYIKQQSILRPYTHVAKDTGVTDVTVYNLFLDHKEALSEKLTFTTPKVMGIDEIFLAKQARCVITNIEERTIIEMLRDRNKPTVIQYLKGVDEAHVILRVTMDMWRPYRDAVIEVLPNAKIIIDKFHVVRMANNAVEKCHKELRGKLTVAQRRDLKSDRFILLKREKQLNPRQQFLLSHWKLNYETLGKVYDSKEAFYAIYDARNGDEAFDRYEAWESGLTADIKPYFHDLHRAVSSWHKEIFSYFHYPETNAYTESMNSVIRHIDRMGRSYGFESIRAKVLYSSNLHHVYKKPKFNKRHVTKDSYGFAMSKCLPDESSHSYGIPEYEEINYGVSIDKLAKMLESGELKFDIEV